MPDKIDILEDVKNIEKKAKAKLLIETTIELKKKIKQIAKLKLECDIALEEVGISKEDRKRIIDFLKDLPESQVDKDEIKQMQKDKKVEVAVKKNDIIEKFGKQDIYTASLGRNDAYNWVASNTTTNAVDFTSIDGSSLKVAL
jgi:hypothetical protein